MVEPRSSQFSIPLLLSFNLDFRSFFWPFRCYTIKISILIDWYYQYLIFMTVYFFFGELLISICFHLIYVILLMSYFILKVWFSNGTAFFEVIHDKWWLWEIYFALIMFDLWYDRKIIRIIRTSIWFRFLIIRSPFLI